MRVNFLIIFLFSAILAHGQDITGIWRGHFRSNEVYQRLMGEDDRYKMEVQIAQHANKLQAVTYSYRSTVFYGKAEADGAVNFKTKKVLLRELKIVEVRMLGGVACIMTCFMQYSKLGDEEFLEGTYTSMNEHDSSDCGKGSIFLHKVPETDFYKEPFLEEKQKEIEKKKSATLFPKTKSIAHAPVRHTPAAGTVKKKTTAAVRRPATHSGPTAKKPAVPRARPSFPQKDLAKTEISRRPIETIKNDSITKIERKTSPPIIPKVLSNRSNELVRTIAVTTPEIILNIYDDGAIDNDTVSVYFDKKLIVSKARLTDQAIVVKLHLDGTDEPHELVMVADNLGDIPPNTSLMIVKAGEKRYEVRIVSTEQQNAVVIFKYEKPQ